MRLPDSTMRQTPNPSEAMLRGEQAIAVTDATQAALARLASTRQLLLQTIAPHKAERTTQTHESAMRFPRRWRALGRLLMTRGPSASLLRAASATAAQGCACHHWAAATSLLGQAVAQEVKPVVRRHPWLAVAAASLLGGAVVSARPLLWRAARPLVAPLGSMVRHGAWRLLTQAPVQMALTAALAAWIGDQRRDAARDSPMAAAAASASTGNEVP